MSFPEIAEKLDIVIKKLKSGGQALTSLCGFLKGIRRATETYTQHVSKLVMLLESELPTPDNPDTQSVALQAFLSYFKERVSSFDTLTSALQLEICEPLELFLDHFSKSNLKWFEEGLFLSREVKKAQKLTQKSKIKYYRAAATAERAEEQYTKQNEYYQAAAHQTLRRYGQAIELTNQKWEEYDARIPHVLESLQESEESRINFFKLLLERVLGREQHLGSQLEIATTEAAVAVVKINPSSDIRMFVDLNKSRTVSVTRETFTSYAEWKETYQSEDALAEPPEVTIAKAIETVIPQLQPDKLAKISHFADILESQEGRTLFVDSLDTKRNCRQLDAESIVQLAALIKIILNSMMLQAHTDPYVCCKLLEFSQVFFTSQDAKRHFLHTYFDNHPLWTSQQMWVDTVEFAAYLKRESDKEYTKRQELATQKRSLVSTLRSFAKRIPHVFQKDESVLRAEKLSVYVAMSQFNFHLIRMGCSQALAHSVILTVAKRAQLDPERTCDLLTEFEANLKSSLSVEQALRLSQSWKVRSVLQFIPKFLDIGSHIELLVVNRAWHQQLKPIILKTWLLTRPAAPGIRNYCWFGLLQPSLINYPKVLSDMHKHIDALADLAEVIDKDVARSFKRSTLIHPQILSNILKAYAYHHSEVGYCQGMNYLAGTLFIQVQDEEMAFRCLSAMLERFEMAGLFTGNLPRLKQFFFQLDRLIALFLPELHEAFREAGVSSVHFASPWFMTVYASTLQHDSSLLFQIWDSFFIKGWKVVFRIALHVLRTFESELIRTDFDGMMFMLNGIIHSELRTRAFPSSLLQDIATVPVSNSLLYKLQEEYNLLKLKASGIS